jgi:hypothetical protein
MDAQLLYHRDDPDVSRTAAVEVTKGPKSEQVMRAIVVMLTDHDPMTPDELESLYFRRRAGEIGWPEVQIKFVQKRASELKKHVLYTQGGIGRPVLRNAGKPINRAQPLTLNCDPMTALQAITDCWEGSA